MRRATFAAAIATVMLPSPAAAMPNAFWIFGFTFPARHDFERVAARQDDSVQTAQAGPTKLGRCVLGSRECDEDKAAALELNREQVSTSM